MKQLWGMTSKVYWFAQEDYEVYITRAVALTNFHIRTNPLRAERGKFYRNYLNCIRDISRENETSCQEQNSRSRHRHQARMNATFTELVNAQNNSESESSEPPAQRRRIC